MRRWVLNQTHELVVATIDQAAPRATAVADEIGLLQPKASGQFLGDVRREAQALVERGRVDLQRTVFGEEGLRRALSDFADHFHSERNHQGKDNLLLFPRRDNTQDEGEVTCQERIGGLLKFYYRKAA